MYNILSRQKCFEKSEQHDVCIALSIQNLENWEEIWYTFENPGKL